MYSAIDEVWGMPENKSIDLDSISTNVAPSESIRSQSYNTYQSDTKCDKFFRHVKTCKKCTKKINKLLKAKLNAKIENIVLNTRLNEMKKNYLSNPPPKSPSMELNYYVIIMGVIMVIIVYFLLHNLTKTS